MSIALLGAMISDLGHHQDGRPFDTNLRIDAKDPSRDCYAGGAGVLPADLYDDDSNPELILAAEMGRPVSRRHSASGLIQRRCRRGVPVCGSRLEAVSDATEGMGMPFFAARKGSSMAHPSFEGSPRTS